jgi:hypothetical protein
MNYAEGILFLIKKKTLYKAQEAAKITGTKVKINLIFIRMVDFLLRIISMYNLL